MIINDHFGYIEKQLRIQRELSIDNVSNDLKISKGYLSEAENGKRKLNEFTFRKFLDFYEIDFDFDPNLSKEVHRLLNDLMEAYTYKNSEKEEQILTIFADKTSSYEKSLACLYIPLFRMMAARKKDPASMSDLERNAFNEIDEYLPAFDNDEIALIFYLKAFQAGKRRAFDQSLDYYAQALAIFDGRLWPQLEGIIKLNYAYTIMFGKSYYEGYCVGLEAHDIFVKHGNYTRALMCDNNIANYLLCLQAFEGAKEYLRKILLSPSIQNVPVYGDAVTTMLITLTLEENFQKAIEFAAEHSIDANNGFIRNLPLVPYYHYRLGQYDQCLEQMAQFDPGVLESDDKALFGLLKAILKGNSAKIEAAKQKMRRICCRQRNWSMLMILYQLLIYYYKSVNDLESLVEAYEENNQVLRHQLPLKI